MFSKAEILAQVYSLVSMVYMLIGLYTLSLNSQKKINRMFLLLCVSLSVWSLCNSVASSPLTPRQFLVASKTSVFAWTFFYSILNHVIIKARVGDEKLSNKLISVLYIPPILMILLILFTVNNDLFGYVYVKGTWGYHPGYDKTFVGIIINLHALLYSLMAIFNLLKWYESVKNKSNASYVKTLILTSILSFVFGFMMEIVVVRVFYGSVPHLVLIYLSFPVMGLFYFLHRSKIVYSEIQIEYDKLIRDKFRNSAFRLMGYFYIILAFISFDLNYFIISNYSDLDGVFELLVLISGLFHLSMDKMTKNQKFKYVFTSITFLIVMYSILDKNVATGGVTVWAVFFFYIILTTVYEKPIYGYLISVSMILMQVWFLFQNPETAVFFDWTDYVGRIIIIAAVSIIIFYINTVYRNRIKENLMHMKIQHMLTEVSSDLLEINLHQLKEQIRRLLNLCVKGFACELSYYIKFEDDISDFMIITSDNYLNNIASLDDIALYLRKDWVDKINNFKNVIVNDIKNDVDATEKELAYFEEHQSSGFYAFPEVVDGKLRSVLVFEFNKNVISKYLPVYETIINNLVVDTIKKLDTEVELYKRANYDKVTGLIDRELFKREVSECIISEVSQENYLLYLNIDNFKVINDSFGHSVGDDVLKEVGFKLSFIMKNQAIVTRFNADEFAVFIKEKNRREDIITIISLLNEIFKKGIRINENEFRININVGVSKFGVDGIDIENLLKNADLAMRKAKNQNKKYHFCTEEDKNELISNNIYTDKLYNALEAGEFVLAFQPQVCPFSERVIGAEALLRWKSEEFGIVPPFKFIPILERTGLIIDVGVWVIDEAVRQIRRIEEQGCDAIRISVNLSVVQFLDNSLVDKLINIIDRYKVDSSLLELEITESVAINDSDYVIETFEKIKELGCQIAIDDFGTQFSSLDRLQALPLDRLKIDKSFVDGIGIDDKREAIVDIVIQLAKRLNLHSIAEGVEEKFQLDYLKEHGCEEIQGYYYAKPMFKEEFENYVKHKNITV